MSQSLIAYARRTPIGRLNGALAPVPAPDLAGAVVRDALATTALDPAAVDECIVGCVLPAGIGQAPARQAAFSGGLPRSVCATTINRVCGSGLKAIMLADQAIRLGDSSIVFAGGAESMTRAPHLLPGSRAGYKFGPVELLDHMQYDGLRDPYAKRAMGDFGDLCAREWHFTREEQDAFAAESYARARRAIESGHFAKEIVPVEVAARRSTTVVETDEEPFAADLSKMASLPPAFEAEGTVTAANASSLNDGAAMALVVSEAAAATHGLVPMARIVAQASFAQDPAWFTTAPIACIRRVLERASLTTADIDIFEINEAFSVVVLAAIRELELDPARVNPHGGAVALGHPIGASGARLVATLLNGLQASGGRYGLAVLCIGGGEASAIVVEML